jgi:hypothetical protein
MAGSSPSIAEDAPLKEAVQKWAETPRSVLKFLRQRRAIINDPTILRHAAALPNWSGSFAFAAKGVAICLLLMQGVIYLGDGRLWSSDSKVLATIKEGEQKLKINTAKLEQNLEDIKTSPDASQFTFKSQFGGLPVSKETSISYLTNEISQAQDRQRVVQDAIDTLTWQTRARSFYGTTIVPLALVIAGMICRRRIAKTLNVPAGTVQSDYLYLMMSYGFIPMLLGSLALGISQPAFDDGGWLQAFEIVLLVVVAPLNWISLGRTGDALAKVLGVDDAERKAKVAKAVISAATFLACLGQVVSKIFQSMIDSSLQALQ